MNLDRFSMTPITYPWAIITYPFFIKKLKKLKNDDEIIVTLAPHFGDIVYGLLYAKQYKIEHNKKIVVFCSEKMKKHLQYYDFIDRVITYKPTKLNDARIYTLPAVRFLNKKNKNGIPKDNIAVSLPSSCYFPQLTCKEIYRDRIYNVVEDKPSFLQFPKTKIISIPNFEENKNKIIILNPYSMSALNTFNSFAKLAENLKQQGYILYTNVIKNQKALPNTLPLNCSIEEFYNIAEQVKCTISVRSGLVDTLLNSNANIFCVYIKSNKRFFFSLKDLKKNNVEEYYIKSNKDTSNLIKVVNNFLNNLNNK